MSSGIRERVIRLINEMRNRSTDRGNTPAEVAAASAKIAEFIERYQIEEAELRASQGDGRPTQEIEVCQNKLRTGKKVFNPGWTQVVSGLAQGMSCKVILLHEDDEAVYGIVGEMLDADFVCQITLTVIPSLEISANLEGAEHGYEKAGLVRWRNQYLTGAGVEILSRLKRDRKERSKFKELEAQVATPGGTALAVITGDSLAKLKQEAAEDHFKALYPKTRTQHSRTQFDPTAFSRGKEAGKRVGLNLSIK